MSETPQEPRTIFLDEMRALLLDPDTPVAHNPPLADIDPNPETDPGD